MNRYQRALDELVEAAYGSLEKERARHLCSVEDLQELVDKATPKKAIARRASWAYDLYCPVCAAWLSSTDMQDDNIELFCKCGQKIKDFYYE